MRFVGFVLVACALAGVCSAAQVRLQSRTQLGLRSTFDVTNCYSHPEEHFGKNPEDEYPDIHGATNDVITLICASKEKTRKTEYKGKCISYGVENCSATKAELRVTAYQKGNEKCKGQEVALEHAVDCLNDEDCSSANVKMTEDQKTNIFQFIVCAATNGKSDEVKSSQEVAEEFMNWQQRKSEQEKSIPDGGDDGASVESPASPKSGNDGDTLSAVVTPDGSDGASPRSNDAKPAELGNADGEATGKELDDIPATLTKEKTGDDGSKEKLEKGGGGGDDTETGSSGSGTPRSDDIEPAELDDGIIGSGAPAQVGETIKDLGDGHGDSSTAAKAVETDKVEPSSGEEDGGSRDEKDGESGIGLPSQGGKVVPAAGNNDDDPSDEEDDVSASGQETLKTLWVRDLTSGVSPSDACEAYRKAWKDSYEVWMPQFEKKGEKTACARMSDFTAHRLVQSSASYARDKKKRVAQLELKAKCFCVEKCGYEGTEKTVVPTGKSKARKIICIGDRSE